MTRGGFLFLSFLRRQESSFFVNGVNCIVNKHNIGLTMKIAFIRKRFDPFGGAENYLQTLCSRLISEGYDISVLTKDWQQTEGVSFYKVPTNPLCSTMSFNRNVKKLIETLKFDCTVSFERTTHQDIYRAGDGCHSTWLRLRAIIENPLRRFSFKINPNHRAILKIEKECFEKTPVIVANSMIVKQNIIADYGISAEKIRVLYNGVDLKRFNTDNRITYRAALRQELGVPEDMPLLVFAGSGYERKGLPTLLRAVSMINDDLMVLAAGKGDIAKYKRLSKTLGVMERVLFLGPVKNIERVYAAGDIFVLPTLYDPFSNASLEAMAAALPVITTMTNGVSELIETGVNGAVLDDPLNAEALAYSIKAIIPKADRMGKNASIKAGDFGIERAASEFISLIDEFVRGKSNE
ncbi:glycosyltransferase family 4 protein [Candidatus Magnetomonas plexicatena]|uniref:glycosyltransferase family 4 protein n=1 Tax=Candidatus Magnetomonas plexicatena TaxID=2552947 RepID=UPI001C76114C|nr:glycosyltransferase family 4 protein [Nitrospirales bacterium LBB_01]